MISGIHAEVLLAAGYAIFLVLVAAGLELLARHSHRRSEKFHVTGFKYNKEFDLWECPTGQHLRRAEFDHARRVVRYRAPSCACNSCPAKGNCTDSDDGREIEHRLESWLESEIRRFHRGISLALLLLAGLIAAVEIVRYNRPREVLLLVGLLSLIGAGGLRQFSEFLSRQSQSLRPPANLPSTWR